MLENLLNTKLKKGLLNIFFNFPKRSFSISELHKLTSGTNALIIRALREFTKAQVVNVASRGQYRYYAVNPYFPLYDEMEDLIADPDLEVEDEVGVLVKKIPNLKLGVLSGIFTLEPQRPVDLLLVGEEISRAKLLRTISEIEKIVGQEINYAVMDQDEFHHRRMMSDRFVRDVMDYPHIVIINTIKNLK